jgi:hypothetical protein
MQVDQRLTRLQLKLQAEAVCEAVNSNAFPSEAERCPRDRTALVESGVVRLAAAAAFELKPIGSELSCASGPLAAELLFNNSLWASWRAPSSADEQSRTSALEARRARCTAGLQTSSGLWVSAIGGAVNPLVNSRAAAWRLDLRICAHPR